MLPAREHTPFQAARLAELPHDVGYALFPTVDAEPEEHASLGSLARRLHRLRRGATIQCVEDRLKVYGRVLKVVSVYRLDEGARSGLIGHAWLQGGGRDALSRALAKERPDLGPGRASPRPAACLTAH